jgi:hypothetical protein
MHNFTQKYVGNYPLSTVYFIRTVQYTAFRQMVTMILWVVIAFIYINGSSTDLGQNSVIN